MLIRGNDETLTHNVPIIAAVADLKAQMFQFKIKFYE